MKIRTHTYYTNHEEIWGTEMWKIHGKSPWNVDHFPNGKHGFSTSTVYLYVSLPQDKQEYQAIPIWRICVCSKGTVQQRSFTVSTSESK